MKILENHHAHLVKGRFSNVGNLVTDLLLSDMGFKCEGNPDYYVFDDSTFSVEQSRKLKDMQSRMSLTQDKMVFILAFDFITREAQNALLKVFEEPTKETFFFIVTAHSDSLLPTLLSRLTEVALDSLDEELHRAESFLKSGVKKRMHILESIIKDTDKSSAIEFLNEIESFLYKTEPRKYKDAFGEIQKARSFLHDRSPSVKMLLEHILLVTPRL